ncbi:MAG: hypothetical protein JNL62_26050 [Bryobacterales bacterium]|nr:hypothetical protein [Bryobacterales bacterium]
MEPWQDATTLEIYAWCYVLLVGSALFPWMNSEIIMLSLAVLVPSPTGQILLVLFGAAGQMTGNSTLYWAGRGVVRFPLIEQKLESWRQKLSHRQLGGMAVLFLSSTFGIPPFYPLSLLSGSLRIPFARFLLVGICGRFLRYGALVFASRLLWLLFR